jgi:hypothetical protein
LEIGQLSVSRFLRKDGKRKGKKGLKSPKTGRKRKSESLESRISEPRRLSTRLAGKKTGSLIENSDSETFDDFSDNDVDSTPKKHTRKRTIDVSNVEFQNSPESILKRAKVNDDE